MAAGKVVYVELVAQVKRFNQGMKKADKSLKKVRKTVGLVSAAIAAVGLIALRQLGQEFDAITEKLDKLGKTAKKTGISTNAIQDFALALQLSGAKGGLDGINKAFQQLLYAQGQAEIGLESYAREFSALGLDLDEFTKLTSDEKLFAITEALASASEGTAARAAQTLLGGRVIKDWKAFLNLTTEQRLELLRESKALGRVTGDQTALAERLDDTAAKLERIKDVIKADVWEAFAKVITPLREQFVEWWKTLSDEKKAGIAKAILASILALIVAVGAALAITAAALLATFGPTVVAAIAAFGPPLLAITGLLYGIGKGVYAVISNFDDLVRSFKWVGEQAQKFLSGIGGKVLNFLGFNGGTLNVEAPTPGRLSSEGGGNSVTTTNIYNVAGNESIIKKLNEREAAQRRGSRR